MYAFDDAALPECPRSARSVVIDGDEVQAL
jgi:hypothetical protein